MMALATHQLQIRTRVITKLSKICLGFWGLMGSYCSFPSAPSSLSRGNKLDKFVPAFHALGRKDRLISLRCRSCSSYVECISLVTFNRRTNLVGYSLVLGSKLKIFRISAFKGNSRREDSGSGSNRSKSIKNPVRETYMQDEGEGSSVESSTVQSSYTAADETASRSAAIQNLFKNWLMLLRATPKSQPLDQAPEESSSMVTSEMHNTIQKQERGDILKAVWCYFLALDAAIKIPLLLFTPLYLGVNLVYGVEVSTELTPLWIIGPLVVALYVKLFKALCRLYIFSFKQTIKVVKNLPVYYMLVYDYVFGGKLKEAILRRYWQPVVDLKNMDYKEVTRQKMKDLQEWLVEKYLDFIESVWPYYCRTIRFLKRANLI